MDVPEAKMANACQRNKEKGIKSYPNYEAAIMILDLRFETIKQKYFSKYF